MTVASVDDRATRDYSPASVGLDNGRRGIVRRCVDTSRAERSFGFRARTGFEDGLRRTVEWYRAQLADGAAR